MKVFGMFYAHILTGHADFMDVQLPDGVVPSYAGLITDWHLPLS